jgi:sulfite reductase alpha subunit-like flavoprotein
MNQPNEKHAIFVLATHYDGDPPDDAIEFNSLLKSETTRELLRDKSIAVFGLGDSNYPLYNNFAKKANAAFDKMGLRR